ncbi:hypothetical protein SprV_0501938000 [Sparganum proliferum]
MGLPCHMRTHESRADCSPDTSTTSGTFTIHSPSLTSSPCAPTVTATTISVTDTDTTDFSCPHCPRTFTSRIGIVDHLRIHGIHIHRQHPPPLPTLASHIHAPHGPIRPHAHPRKPAVDNRRLHHTVTPPITISPHVNITHRKHPTATSHASGKCASRLGLRAAPVAWVTRA